MKHQSYCVVKMINYKTLQIKLFIKKILGLVLGWIV